MWPSEVSDVEQVLNGLVVFADGWDMHDWGGGWWVVMMLAMFLFWGLVIAAIVWLVRAGRHGASSGGAGKGAQELLDERLAAGDLSIEEYERRRAALAGKGSPPPPPP
jgi:putative membrane protein